jgi:hypothetical protein
MAVCARDEGKAAFRVNWQAGAAGEDRGVWVDLLTEGAVDLEPIPGRPGGAESRTRIAAAVQRVPELRSALGWPVQSACATPAVRA